MRRPFNWISSLLLDAALLAPEAATTPATCDLAQRRKALLVRQVSVYGNSRRPRCV